MRKLALLAGLIAFTTAARADDKKPKPAAKNNETKAADAKPTTPDASKTGAILLAPGDIKWTPDPKRAGTYMALAEGNPDKGPAHFFLKYDKGFAGGLHHHTNDHGGWILQGTVILVVDDVETKLPPGSFYFIKQMVAAQHPGLVEGWVFPTEKGMLHKGHPLRNVLEDALDACKIERRVTPHGLRHTANNELRRVANGEVVRAIIGHATEAMTHHYSHVGEDEKRDAVARVFAIVKGDERVVSGVVDSNAATRETANEPENVGGATRI